MVRVALRLLCCSGLILAGVVLVHAGPEHDQKIENTLKVTTAFNNACDALKSGQFRVAVDSLESQLDLIGDNRAYLNALRDAYQRLIQELQQKNQPDEAARYQRRLKALDPGALLEIPRVGNSRPVDAPVPTPAPVAAPVPTSAPVAAPPAPKVAQQPSVPPEQDPFGDANSVRSHQVRTLLEQADRQFALQKYDPACRLYEQVFGLEQEVSPQVKERWAFCKLQGVGLALNQKGLATPAQEMEREVRRAMSIAPKIEIQEYGNYLLRKIQERQGAPGPGAAVPAPVERGEDLAAVEIKHLQGQERGWSVCETPNFRIFHKQAREHVERVARAAEAARSASARKWFGEVPPTWSRRCDLYLHATKEEYSQETKQPPDCPGHSSLGMEGERCVSRRVDLHCDDLNMVYGVVPHEITHVVLAGRFGVQDLPRWADEGMAVMSEPRDRIEKHLRNLPQHRRDRQLFAVSDLMRYNEYPEGKYIGAFYAQSVSLVDFLCQQKGTQAFALFLRDGLRNGYEVALRQHYGFSSFQDLQQRWQAATFSDASARADRGTR